MALAMGPRKKNVHDPGFAKKRDEAQVVEERNHRVGAAARKAGVGFTAKNKRQAVFIFLNEPESSASARLFSLVIVLAIVVSSVSFVAETVPYFKNDPSCNNLGACGEVKKQSDNSTCEADARCVFSETVCVAAAAEVCEAASGNETACGMLADCAFVGGGCSAVANCAGADPCVAGIAIDGCLEIPGGCEQADPCTSEWEGDLGLPASVANSDDDARRKKTCEANPHCEYRNTLVWLHIIETICIAIFTFEYIFKLVTCTQRPDNPNVIETWGDALRDTFQFARQTMNLIDLFAILPWFVKQFTQGSDHGAPILRMLRMVRIFRILKFGGHVRNLQLFAIGFKRAQEGLVLLLFLLLLYLCVFATILYMLEYDDQREAGNSGFTSIPTTWYYICATMTTVGYGDHYPITPWGQFVGSCCMLCGIFVLGLPIVVVGGAFDEVFKEEDEEQKRIALEVQRLEDAAAAETDGGVGGGAEGGAEAVETFNTEASIRAMAALMEQLFYETGNDRFDTAYNRLLQPPHAHV